MDFGAIGDGVNDDTVAIRNAIAAISQQRGGGIFFPQPPKNYRITDTILIDRPALCLYGEFKPGQNESGYYGHHGTVIVCECPNKTAFIFDHTTLQHSGPKIESLGFIASDDTVSLIEIRDHNSWVIRDVVFRGGSIALSIIKKEDNAWNLVDNCTFWGQTTYGIYDGGYGTEVRGGKFIVGGTGIHLTPLSQHSRISNVMFDKGIGIECYGGVHHISDCKFEKCDLGIVIDGDKNVHPLSGKGNRISGGTYGNTGVGVGIWVESGGNETNISNPHFVWLATDILDNGSKTKISGV